MLNSLAAVGFSSTLSTAPLPVFPPGRCPGAVRYAPGLSFGVGDVAKLPVVQSIWNEFVGADGAQLVPDETYFDKAENAATLILKSDRTTEETAEVKPFIRDLCVSIHTIDTPVSNQEVHHPPHAHPPPAQPAHPSRPPSDPASVSHPSAGERALEGEVAAGRRWPMGLGDRRPEAVRLHVRSGRLPVVDRGHRHLPNAVGFLRGQEVLAHRQRAHPVQEQGA
jgi:hypothetical protein